MGCCDRYTLVHVSAITTAIQAVVFGIINILLICLKTCTIKFQADGFLGMFRVWYFYDVRVCTAKGYTLPPVILNESYPIQPRPSHTTVDANFTYQIVYLVLHILWFFSSITLIYGNSRKRWSFYLPWLTLTLTLVVMDLTLTSFYISDMVTIAHQGVYWSALTWIFSLYIRGLIIWVLNAVEFGIVLSACFNRGNRSNVPKQPVQQPTMEMTEVAAATAAAASHQEEPLQYQQPQPQQQQQQSQPQYEQPLPYQEGLQRAGYSNAAFEEQPPPPLKKQAPPVPKKPKAPPEVRPFNYLNPSFRPANSSDLEGMRANASYASDAPTAILRKPVLHPEEVDYFPTDGYTQPASLNPLGVPRRHDSMRNFHTQATGLPPMRRYASARGAPKTTPYTPPPDYDFTLGRPRPVALDNQKLLPRATLNSTRAPLGQVPRDASYQPHPHRPHSLPPASPTRAYTPPPTSHTRAYTPPPTSHTRAYTPPPASHTRPYTPPPTSHTRAYTPPPTSHTRAYTPPPASHTRPHSPAGPQEQPNPSYPPVRPNPQDSQENIVYI